MFNFLRKRRAGPSKTTEWSPGGHLKKRPGVESPPAALLILNQPIYDIAGFRSLWHDCTYRICADGGANRLHDFVKEVLEDLPHEEVTRDRFLPDKIRGDLDSLRPEVELYYRDRGVHITKDPDQDSTDFTKCLKDVDAEMTKRSAGGDFDVIVLGGLAGRVDQAFSTIHHLYATTAAPVSNVSSGNMSHVAGASKIYLYSDESISFVLQKGKNVIRTPMGHGVLAENIGILPIGGPAVISTNGLEWDVENWMTEFGGQISTSNHIRSDVVEVETSERVLFTLERSGRQKKKNSP
ncbi:MAG: hypothetical protein M4579_003431 [Chaenotheca gracillima]|nr:MAG: hypothetical protein M4579_003431 [Chaenotheca gracillima]